MGQFRWRGPAEERERARARVSLIGGWGDEDKGKRTSKYWGTPSQKEK